MQNPSARTRRLQLAGLAAAATLAVAACTDASPTAVSPAEEVQSASSGTTEDGIIPGRYIVTLRGEETDVPARARRLTAAHGGRVRTSYVRALRGFSVELSPRAAAEMARDPGVAAIEPDRLVTLQGTEVAASWGLDRIDQRALPLNGSFTFARTAWDVHVYVIDSGIQSDHPQFGGRVINEYDLTGGDGEDCLGHGTHVAGTVGSASYGIAKSVMLHGIRVFGCSNTTPLSTIIAGVDYVTQNHAKPAVANLSLSSAYSSALNNAVMNLVSSGVFVAVAAGNESTLACNRSPSAVTTATVVAASTPTDARASYSNYGSCVDLYAPGTDVLSTYIGGGAAVMSGTSMAAPHVAGVAALYKAANGDSAQAAIESWLKNRATGAVIKANISGTPNKLLFKGAL